MSSRKNDRFADIAMTRTELNNPELEYPQSPELEEILLPLGRTKAEDFTPLKTMSTPEELREELDVWKKRYRPFLQNLAPEPDSSRHRLELNRFDWRIEEEEDRRDFSRVLSGGGTWETVEIPHYGGPLGKAVTYYRTAFTLEKPSGEGETCWICFKGADYRAHVFVNGAYAGSHEGFFAPFEFDVSSMVRPGENILTVKLENDYIFGGNVNAGSRGERFEGDKLYAATGPGYDDPAMGWHHCPPGMGIYQDVFLEIRRTVHVHDLFIRPLPEEESAEAWVEVASTVVEPRDVKLLLSLYGQNFEEVLFEDQEYVPSTSREVGLGDSFTEQKLRAEGLLDQPVKLKMEKGINLLKIPLSIPDPRLWEPDSPWLYQLQVKLVAPDGTLLDVRCRQFGMRTFRLATDCTPKGMFHLNGRPVRLRGANTMGHEQQCVMKKDWDQLIEDLLLARICHMNFLRLTQRPVQREVYEYCDRLGLMTQTDLPLFGVLKRDRFCEAVRQAEEMERLVRSHPCSILVSYINEPFPNAANKPHRHLSRPELEAFFRSADTVVKLNNPDRVIKHVDGDYDPPSDSLPDNHCYTFWYNGHGVDAGELMKGHWMPVRKGWNYGCGEFGVEGLESAAVMRRYYPPEWLPRPEEEEKTWSPRQIVGAQTGNFHYLFYPTPDRLEEWVRRSQIWQAEGLKMMTEAFRRDPRMVTFAVHLFIDAFPSGWMKTIMDCERNPKPGYFAYRNALTPLMVSLRTDRLRYTAGETVRMETWICNDRNEIPEGARLLYRAELKGRVVASGETDARIPLCSSAFQGFLEFEAPGVETGEVLTVRAALAGRDGEVLYDAAEELKIFPVRRYDRDLKVWMPPAEEGVQEESGIVSRFGRTAAGPAEADLILLRRFEDYTAAEETILEAVEAGARLLFLNLPPGEYEIAGSRTEVRECGMMPVHFAAPAEGEVFPDEADGRDFRFWFDRSRGRISPLLHSTFTAEGFVPVMTSGNTDGNGEWGPALAAGEKPCGRGSVAVCQIELEGRLAENPPAVLLAERMVYGGQ